MSKGMGYMTGRDTENGTVGGTVQSIGNSIIWGCSLRAFAEHMWSVLCSAFSDLMRV